MKTFKFSIYYNKARDLIYSDVIKIFAELLLLLKMPLQCLFQPGAITEWLPAKKGGIKV